MLKFCLRIRYSSKSSGPSKASRKTSSASGGMYRSCGSANSGSPYRRQRHLIDHIGHGAAGGIWPFIGGGRWWALRCSCLL